MERREVDYGLFFFYSFGDMYLKSNEKVFSFTQFENHPTLNLLNGEVKGGRGGWGG